MARLSSAILLLLSIFVPSQSTEEECHKNYLILQAHHDHCDHHDLPTAAEHALHEFEDKYEDCEVERQYNTELDNCPTDGDCSDNAALTAHVAYLNAADNNCATNCGNSDCQEAIQYVLMAHDTCEEDELPDDLETTLHEFEGVCEEQLCNTHDKAFVPECEEDDHDHRRGLEEEEHHSCACEAEELGFALDCTTGVQDRVGEAIEYLEGTACCLNPASCGGGGDGTASTLAATTSAAAISTNPFTSLVVATLVAARFI